VELARQARLLVGNEPDRIVLFQGVRPFQNE
jgi:hypothetical protein